MGANSTNELFAYKKTSFCMNSLRQLKWDVSSPTLLHYWTFLPLTRTKLDLKIAFAQQ
jgi:hypothetical protein